MKNNFDIKRGQVWDFGGVGNAYYEIISVWNPAIGNNNTQISFVVRKFNPDDDEAWTEPLDIMIQKNNTLIANKWNESLRNSING